LKDEKGSYLELVRPKAFRDDEVQALFFDEFNRSHKNKRNAVMELMQFKSINGRKFPITFYLGSSKSF
jgi:MoxR-like ATPase